MAWSWIRDSHDWSPDAHDSCFGHVSENSLHFEKTLDSTDWQNRRIFPALIRSFWLSVLSDISSTQKCQHIFEGIWNMPFFLPTHPPVLSLNPWEDVSGWAQSIARGDSWSVTWVELVETNVKRERVIFHVSQCPWTKRRVSRFRRIEFIEIRLNPLTTGLLTSYVIAQGIWNMPFNLPLKSVMISEISG